MLAIACLCHIHFCSYYQVGLDVVQMVCYFKTSQSIRVIAPLNGHFKSELRWHVQNQRHIKRTICTFICSKKKKKNILLAPLGRHFTSNVSRNVHATTYFASCEKVPTGTFSSLDQVEIHTDNIYLSIYLSIYLFIFYICHIQSTGQPKLSIVEETLLFFFAAVSKLVWMRIMKFDWYCYRLPKFWYRDNP